MNHMVIHVYISNKAKQKNNGKVVHIREEKKFLISFRMNR